MPSVCRQGLISRLISPSFLTPYVLPLRGWKSKWRGESGAFNNRGPDGEEILRIHLVRFNQTLQRSKPGARLKTLAFDFKLIGGWGRQAASALKAPFVLPS